MRARSIVSALKESTWFAGVDGCPGGWFVVEVPQRQTAVAQLKTSERLGSGEQATEVRRVYRATDHTVEETFSVAMPDGRRQFHLQYHLFDQDELTDLLRNSGYLIRAAFGGYDGSPLTEASPLMLIIALKNQM